jgi:amino acid adenylation domain-containing protein
LISGNTLAFLQYTSGSTAEPKGVMVGHGNLLNNQRLIQRCFDQTEKSIIVGWLPLYHDMGLIGNVLHSLYLGAPCILMSPASFLQKPLRWLSAISTYKATTSGGPNFAYDLCVRRISPEQCETLDLSTWTTAFNGAEPIRAETIERFSERFASCGFKAGAFAPCYGLAEATLIVSGGIRPGAGMTQTVESAALERNRVIPAAEGSEGTRAVLSCGQIVADHKIEIVDAGSMTACSPDQVGEVWVSGPSVTRGYWNRERETNETFQGLLADSGEDRFLRTGDLGFISEGQLFVTGRTKDLVIILGRNLYPQDIELTVELSHNALRPGCGAAFADDVAGQERLVVVQELEPRTEADLAEVVGAIRQAVSRDHEVQAHAIVVIKPGTIPKTSSGKIQRHACRAKFQTGELDVIAEWRASAAASISDVALDSSALPLEDAESIESWLASQLAAKLGLDTSEIDTSQPLVCYGIDSIVALEIAHAVERRLGVLLSVASLVEGATLAELTTEVVGRIDRLDSAGKGDLIPATIEAGEYPLSYDQRALWFLHQLAPESAAYNLSSAVSIEPGLNASALRRAFQLLVKRHSCLRTTFKNDAASGPVQMVAERADLFFEEVDATAWSEAELEVRLALEAERPFDLEGGPLLRVHLFKRPLQTHIMLLVIHHIIADLWSLAIMMTELGTVYQAEDSGRQASLPPLKLSYVNHVLRQTEMLTGGRGTQLRDYWERQLDGELPVLNLPADRPRPAVQTFAGASRQFELRAETTQALKSICRKQNATLFMGLLAVFQAFLHRYTGQEDLLIGSPTSGRDSADLAGLVGYFVNPLVLRTNLSSSTTFPQFLDQVRRAVIGAFAHQDYPLSLLIERLQPERDPSRSPLFQSMFIFQKLGALPGQDLASFALGRAGARAHLGELSIEPVTLSQQTAQLDLTLRMAELDAGIAAALDYNTDLFEAATIDRLADHFQIFLEAVVANPSARISEQPLLADVERRRILSEWNDTTIDYPRDLCIHQLIEQQVERTPEAIAVVFEEEQISYRELNARANQLAHYLRSQGIGGQARVGILLERSIELLVGLTAILKAGATYVPLDPSYPEERLSLMSRDAGLSILLTQRRLPPMLSSFDSRRVCLDSQLHEIASASRANPAINIAPDCLAYVIYTSGSTGTPKGVMVTHRNVVNFCAAMDRRIGCEPTGTWLAVTSVSFDISVFELLWTLARGFRVVIQPDLQRAGDDADHAPAMQIRRHQASHVQCTPAMARMLTLEPDAVTSLAGLSKLLVGGDALPLSLANELGRTVKGEIHNMYGPTETTVWSTTSLVDRQASRISIGRPIANTEVYIIDKNQQPLPTGAPGELCIGGDGVVRGYHHLPDLTAGKFIPNAFGSNPGSRLYRTGDLARYLPDGDVELLGRADYQVKVRGFRIEPGEVELTLGRHPSVREAAVLALRDSSGENRLIGYVVGNDNLVPIVSELRSFLKEKLPIYMVPSQIVVLDQMPLTPNGKVDRRALLACEPLRPEREKADSAPRNAIEEVLAVLSAEILDLDTVGIHDDFFELGGHSLLAARFIAQVREMLRVQLPLRAFFKAPTVAGVAASMAEDLEQRARAQKIAELFIGVAQYTDDQVEAKLGE